MRLREGRSALLETPPHVDRYLLDSEIVVIAVRRHMVQVAEPILSVVVGLLVVGWLSEELPGLPFLVDAAWWGWFFLVARAMWRLVQWQNDWFIATDRRLLLTYGVLTRRVAMMPLRKVTDLSYNRSPAGRLLGYGEFVLESAGQDQAMHRVNWLPDPDDLYRRICGELFDPKPRAAAVDPDDADLGDEGNSGGEPRSSVTGAVAQREDPDRYDG